MNPPGSTQQPSEASDLRRYQQAADLAYQYAKRRVEKQEEPGSQQLEEEKDQAES